MYICVCSAVTEQQIHRAVDQGALTFKDLQRELGVASECACCAGSAKKCLRQAISQATAAGMQLVA